MGNTNRVDAYEAWSERQQSKVGNKFVQISNLVLFNIRPIVTEILIRILGPVITTFSRSIFVISTLKGGFCVKNA